MTDVGGTVDNNDGVTLAFDDVKRIQRSFELVT